jgi:hypothetical protein
MFASKSLVEHALRGVIGVSAIVAAVFVGRASGGVAVVASLVLAAIALVAFRGCPICWTIGMVETMHQRFGLERVER